MKRMSARIATSRGRSRKIRQQNRRSTAPSAETKYHDAFSQGRDRWVDIHGQPPKLDAQGRLTEVFTTALYNDEGELMKVERWGVGVRLPTPPGVLEREAAERERKPQEQSNGRPTAFKTTAGGKRHRKRDDELTPEQLVKRNKNRANNAARKRRMQEV